MVRLATVAIAFDDVGLAIPVQEALEAAGHRVTLRAGLVPDAAPPVDAVILPCGADLAATAAAWRERDPPPALLAVGPESDQRVAAAARVAFLATTSEPAGFAAAHERAIGTRWLGRMSPAFARGALGLTRDPDPMRDAARIVAGARRMVLDVARDALRGDADRYVTAGPMIPALREARALDVPEIELVHRMDGAHTVRTVVASGPPLEATAALRGIWALCSIGAATLSDEPPDGATPARRAVAEARRHVRTRRARVARTTIYDVLEIERGAPATEIEPAVRALAIRFAPERLAGVDLGDLRDHVAPMWEQIGKARALLGDLSRLARYDNQILAQPPAGAIWCQGPFDRTRAEQHFARGQRALVEGEAFKAVSELASAARLHPDHPDYEASLAWARFRPDVTRGKDKLECARRERAVAEAVTYGRRPWPRALVALALLSAAAEDADAARWHLREALECDPTSPAAQQLLSRLTRPA
jgi:hypothetical protein